MSYDRYETRRRRQRFGANSGRTTFGYWVPLALTVTAATIGLAAWVWKERSDEDEDEARGHNNRPAQDSKGPEQEYREYGRGELDNGQDDAGFVARMSGALRRTPSPQQLFDEAGRRVAAGVAAAGAAVGGALTSIREEGKGDYEDHSRWSEEAETRASLADTSRLVSNNGRTVHLSQKEEKGELGKRVAVVISAELNDQVFGSDESTYLQEHASILSHLPEHMDDNSRIFVMIHTPQMRTHPLKQGPVVHQSASVASSYSVIAHDDIEASGEGNGTSTGTSPRQFTSLNTPMFNSLYAQARALVDKECMIMPFTTHDGYISLLRHINPGIVYVQAPLAGENGAAVKQVSSWAGQVVLVVGDDTGHGGLVDSEDERGAYAEEKGRAWWKEDQSVGLGKIEVVEGLRIGEDWRRRVKGHN